MESIDRACHPSLEQVEALVHYLEEKPHLAKGFLRNQSAKAQAHKEWEPLWERITLKLNSIGGGTIKNVKKWIKYWADKKSAVKKKSATRAAARRRTGGGTEVVPVLSEVEERIVALMGGDGFATGDVHLQIQETPPLPISPSILTLNTENTIDQPRPSTSQDDAYQSQHPVAVDLEPLNVNTSQTRHSGIYQPLFNNPDPPPTTAFQASAPRERSPGAASNHRNVEEGNATPPHCVASAVSTPRRRRVRLRRSPPSQRRSQFYTVLEKFLTLEEQRISLERRMVTVLERNSETQSLMAQANIALGEGLKALAEIIKKD